MDSVSERRAEMDVGRRRVEEDEEDEDDEEEDEEEEYDDEDDEYDDEDDEEDEERRAPKDGLVEYGAVSLCVAE